MTEAGIGRYDQVEDCPQCGRPLVGGGVFVLWCANCEWNLDPLASSRQPTAGGWRARRAETRADRAVKRGDALYRQVAAETGVARPSGGVTRAATALALVVLLADVGLIVAGAWIAVATWFEPVTVIGVVLALLGIAGLGRPAKRPAGRHLRPSDAPRLFELCDDIGRRIGTGAPDEIVVSSSFNASIGRFGFRGRRVMIIGTRLWTLLDGQERVAVLAHELGHNANGDPSRGLVVGLAVASLRRWSLLLQPPTATRVMRARYGGGRSGAMTRIAQLVSALVLLPLSALLLIAGRGLNRLRARGGSRAEYVADELAASVAGSTSMIGALQVLVLVPSCVRALEARAARGERGGELEFLRRHLDEMPPSEKDRLTRIARRERTGVDATHPPLVSRIALLSGRPRVPPAVIIGAGRAAALDSEVRLGSQSARPQAARG